MNTTGLTKDIEQLRQFFQSGKTKRWDYRVRQLKALRRALLTHQDELYQALRSDLNKSPYEASFTEWGQVMAEIDFMIKHLRRWMKPSPVRLSLAQMPGRARQYPESYGVVLIVSPWNYPVLLSLMPLIGAIAAGNCVVLKPSAYTAKVSGVLKEILRRALPETVLVVEGGREENQALFSQPFDYIFFTGSAAVGQEVLRRAAEHLTPVTLELGGKSPAIVDASANIAKAARRILFGKLLNAGQTCIAPDYVWVERAVKHQLLDELQKQAAEMLSGDLTRQWVKIVNQTHYDRLAGYLADQPDIWQFPEQTGPGQFPFTLVDQPDWQSRLMQEEIFGPILPILSFETLDQVVAKQKQLPKPLAVYLFSKRRSARRLITRELSFGGGCINDTLVQQASSHLPFGGVGASGMGQYHGKASFDTFSHYKGVLHKSWLFDIPIRYLPYKAPDKTIWRRLLG